MGSWQGLFYSFGVQSIERAYRASLRAFEEELASLNEQWQQHLAEVAAGRARTVEEDEETGAYFDYGEHMGELMHQAEEGARLVREAFCLNLYHYWEKKACELLGLSDYNYQKAFDGGQAKGWAVDRAAINLLREAARCIKHDAGAELYGLRPDLFDADDLPDPEAKRGWHDALRLDDAFMGAAFASVRSSGPRPKPWRGVPEEVTFEDASDQA